MNIVTIFDYPETNRQSTTFLKIWLNRVNLYAKGGNVYIIHGEHGIPAKIRHFIDRDCGDIRVTLVPGKKNPTKYDIHQLDNNFHVNFNGYNALTFGQHLNQPIIYLDLDAFLFSDLHEWWDIVRDKPHMGLGHYPIGKNLNAGVYSISDWDYINFDKLMDRFFVNLPKYNQIREICGDPQNEYTLLDSVFTDTGLLKSGDQSLFINYYVGSGNSPFYDKLGLTWNVFGRYCDVKRVGLNWVPEKLPGGWQTIDKIRIAHYYAGSKEKLYESDFYKHFEKLEDNL